MNDVLTLKGKFEHRSNSGGGGSPRLPQDTHVSADHVLSLIQDLKTTQAFWKKNNLLDKYLISAHYIKVAAKSNRIQGFFAYHKENPNNAIVGAKFAAGPVHVITYFVSPESVSRSIVIATQVATILEAEFGGAITAETFNNPKSFASIDFKKYSIPKTTFQQFVVDAHYVDHFGIESGRLPQMQSAIVSLYDTQQPILPLLKKLGITADRLDMLDDTTIRLDAGEVTMLMEKAPFLVAMATTDLSKLSPTAFHDPETLTMGQIPEPKNEPTIGVIDTLFDDHVYFNKWVTYTQMIDPNIPIDRGDYYHGTAVTSIIVDGSSLNPSLDDGCGRFKVRHFGVATSREFSSFEVIKSIKQIVASNPDIHVWNLSLGSKNEVNPNFISAEASVLDQLQYKYNVIFVIAATNKEAADAPKRIGAPADSINSLVVSSVDRHQQPAAYSREGIVLEFFTKPDVSYYGGVGNDLIRAVEPISGGVQVGGTSFAAPWISRKLAYLIEVLGLSREVAKAMVVDSAIGWHPELSKQALALRGNGVVPLNIQDILHTRDDEIKFVIQGTVTQWETYNYQLPVPVVANKQPYVAKATLCYFPKCSRNQGVDYTNTELDLYLGRINDKGKIKSINENVQSFDNTHRVNESDARENFRKWDNIKHISEVLKPNARAKKVYSNPMWGISLKTKERLSNHDGEHIRFGLVVTLKEINGVNRIDDFIQQASLKGWLINRIDVANRVKIYNQAEEDVHLE
ncbi:S8 family peptidase [Lacticaseibacillus chiayiensis]|uniref:S8 family peptidase n=1 Tax=Lacticaseibacillus chiayiensis TaxID=2100821 RepID=UPI00101306C0|nr:S8 family peptidase [Lacticaseibacillus chiayiensis]RXT58563.1 serine protease [Lacticaseibacillus chiayiensis]